MGANNSSQSKPPPTPPDASAAGPPPRPPVSDGGDDTNKENVVGADPNANAGGTGTGGIGGGGGGGKGGGANIRKHGRPRPPPPTDDAAGNRPPPQQQQQQQQQHLTRKGSKRHVDGFAYSCTGATVYTSEMERSGRFPICAGIGGRKKRVELAMDRPPPPAPSPDRARRRPPGVVGGGAAGDADRGDDDDDWEEAGRRRAAAMGVGAVMPSNRPPPRQAAALDRMAAGGGGGGGGGGATPAGANPGGMGDDFKYVCLGYSHIILEAAAKAAAADDQSPKNPDGGRRVDEDWRKAKVLGMPHCEMGINLIQHSTAAPGASSSLPPAAAPLPDQRPGDVVGPPPRRRTRRYTARPPGRPIADNDNASASTTMDPLADDPSANENENENENDDAAEDRDEEDLDGEIARLRRRMRQVIERNEMDPRTWRRREEEERRRQRELEKQQQRRQLAKRDENGGGGGLDAQKFQAYLVKTATKTVQHMRSNASHVWEELHNDLPNRIYRSSQRIVGNFGRTVDLCGATAERAKESVAKLYRSWRGGDDDGKGGGGSGGGGRR